MFPLYNRFYSFFIGQIEMCDQRWWKMV